jgi:hypothetical protein
LRSSHNTVWIGTNSALRKVVNQESRRIIKTDKDTESKLWKSSMERKTLEDEENKLQGDINCFNSFISNQNYLDSIS